MSFGNIGEKPKESPKSGEFESNVTVGYIKREINFWRLGIIVILEAASGGTRAFYYGQLNIERWRPALEPELNPKFKPPDL